MAIDLAKCIPFNGLVLIKADPVKESASLIDLDEKEQKKSTTGVVIKHSEEKNGITYFAKEGMRVLFGAYAGTEVTVAGEPYLLMKDSDVFAEI